VAADGENLNAMTSGPTTTQWRWSYMEAALNQVRASSGRIEDDDVRRLSPLIHGHLNFLGRYHFSLPSDVRDGELRGLRDPSAGLDPERQPCEKLL
jgi:hypothetical protein